MLIRGDRMLLTYQQQPEPEFQLPGGGIDPGEGAITALHREVMEETGWTISAPRRVGAYRRFCYLPEYEYFAEKFCTIWLARPVMRLREPSEPYHSARWVAADDAVDLLPDPGSKRLLRRALLMAR